jgi:hypothetical protein
MQAKVANETNRISIVTVIAQITCMAKHVQKTNANVSVYRYACPCMILLAPIPCLRDGKIVQRRSEAFEAYATK